LNLLTDRWLPARRRLSGRCTIRPAQLCEALDDDPVIAIDWPRADFRVAAMEFLIGLLATACPPEDHEAWMAGWESPPRPETLDAAFAPIAHAFNLDGDGPRFLQDLEELVSGVEPIERLLIETPGDSTVRKNTDLLVHRDRVVQLSRAAAAMALYTFQAWAPAGGAGNRTGLRGGGPLTTLVLPPSAPSLWHMLWANVPPGQTPTAADLPRVFPWLAPTVTSEGARIVTPLTAHPLQCWWGMPRRIRLDFSPMPDGVCGITGTPDTVVVASWRQRPRGANYASWGRVHPLTPHYTAKPGAEWLPVHPQPGGTGYRHWLGWVMASPDRLRLPAATIAKWREERGPDTGRAPARLLAAGYDMDNMKARGFVESEVPLPAAPDAATRAALDDLATRLVEAADIAARGLRMAVRNALFSAGATVKRDAEALSAARERLWDVTEPAFYAGLEQLAGGADRKTLLTSWQKRLLRDAPMLFDEFAPITPDGFATAPRISKARRGLVFALTGYGKEGDALFNKLQLAPVQARTKAKGKAA